MAVGRKHYKKKTLTDRKSNRKPLIRKQFISRRIPSAPPNHQMVALHYSENIAISGTPTGSYIFRINDLYDPNRTGTGSQPLYRDQMFTIYKWARVLGAKITVSYITSLNDSFEIVLGPIQGMSVDPSADTTISTAAERKGTRSALMTNQQTKKLSCYMSSDQFFGASKGTTLLSTTYLQDSGGGLPADTTMWYQILVNSISATNFSAFYCKVDITQYVRFEQPTFVGSS